ncbi:MAG: MMPL family transporter [Pseudomonadota bacterium]
MRAYTRLLAFPRLLLFALLALAGVAGYYATQFRFDASSDTLVVEGDPDLAAYTRIAETFSGDDFLLLTFAPNDGEPFSRANLDRLADLAADLREVPGVGDTFTALDLPLFESPPVTLASLAERIPTLLDPAVDLDLAKQELMNSPLFRELLISADGRATAIRVGLNASATNLAKGSPDEERRARERFLAERAELIANVRAIRDRYADFGELFLGGVPMIAADMIDYVKSDLQWFGGAVLFLMMAVLYLFFRRPRWVLLPILTSGITVLFSVGVLGFLDKPATVVSSNFMALLAIITISLTIHLIVRYRELLLEFRDASHAWRVEETMASKFAPCLYTAVTTIAAFGSLMASRILPVEDFGWMMCVGIAVAFFVCFTFFPAALLIAGGGHPSKTLGQENALTRALGQWARWRSGPIIFLSFVCVVLCVVGIARLSLDNRFVDYFADETEIHRGMKYIDQQLGGTIPFEVVVQFSPYEPLTGVTDDDFADDFSDDFADDFADDFSNDLSDDVFDNGNGAAVSGGAEDPFPERYWFTRDKLNRLAKLHEFLEQRPEIGKVLSLTALEQLAHPFTGGRNLTSPEIAGLLAAVPAAMRKTLVLDYADPASGQLRLNARIHETGPSFDRDELVAEIRRFAVEEVGFEDDEIVISGMMVLFNRMLTQLFDSQIDTLAYVLAATMVMFLILLRSLPYALIGLIPNILAAALVLAFMGFMGLPLDMMTTTIAAISIGIGVDDAIHYLHRFKLEQARWEDPRVAVSWSHASIGNAMYFTTLTVMVGFSVMAFSNFVPTVLFGLLVAAAMALALFANLTLLPSLLVWFYGRRHPEPTLRNA